MIPPAVAANGTLIGGLFVPAGAITNTQALATGVLGGALLMTHPNHDKLFDIQKKIDEAKSQYDDVFEMREAESDPLQRGNLKVLLDQLAKIIDDLRVDFNNLL